MKVLGIDTSGYVNAIGVVDGGRVLADFAFEARTDSLQKIILNIDFALKSAGLTLEDIEGIGVGLGPGSWTGIRVGVTVGKMLAYSTKKPVCGVPTLEVLAYGAGDKPVTICSVINAGTKDTVYAACYHIKDGTLTRAGEYYVGNIKGLSEMVKEGTVLIGAEAESYRQLIAQSPGSLSVNIKAVKAVPGGSAVALLAAGRLERGEHDDVLSLAPLYLKESTARAFQARQPGGAPTEGRDL